MKKLLPLAVALLAAAPALRAETATYAPDPNHTFAYFEVGHLGLSTIKGRFDKKEGLVQLDRAAKTGKVEFTIDTGSVNTGVTNFDRHLASKDFFNAAEFPTAKFVGDKFVFNGDKLAEVSGNLTMAGKTNPLTLKAVRFNCTEHPMLKREACGGDFEGTLQRSQYGINWGLDRGFPDNVKLIVQIEAIKQ